MGWLLYVVIFGVVTIVVVGYKVITGKKGKPEQTDDSMYGETSEYEEEPFSNSNENEE